MVLRKLVTPIFLAVAIGTTTSTYSLQRLDEQPVVLQAVSPVFSNLQAQIPKEYQNVVIKVIIDPSGNVISADRVSGIDVGHAKQAALRWKFSAWEESKGERTANLKFNFRFMPEEAPEEDITPIFKPPYEVEIRRRIELVQK